MLTRSSSISNSKVKADMASGADIKAQAAVSAPSPAPEERGKTGRFLLKLALFGLILVGFLLALMPSYSTNYSAVLLDKTRRLETVQGPKIVLVGNSNVAFGFDSAAIEKAFKMPVVNMGFTAELGNALLERAATRHVQRGDIYVLCHSNYAEDDQPVYSYLWYVIENHTEMLPLLRRQDILPFIGAYPTYVRNCLHSFVLGRRNRDIKDWYCRKTFNSYGDIDWPRTGPTFQFSGTSLPKLDQASAQRINALAAVLQKKGASLVIAGYPLVTSKEHPVDLQGLEAFQRALEKAMKVPVISQFKDYIYPYEDFYNTSLHLTEKGAELRTAQLIQDLQRYLAAR